MIGSFIKFKKLGDNTMNQNKIIRCQWIDGKPDYYIKYHDYVWGKIEKEDQELFKWLSLEIFHIGLSWQLVLSKYDAFMEAFDSFNIQCVADYNREKIDHLMKNDKIIRYRKKIEAIVHNAQLVKKIQQNYGSLYYYLWSFTDGKQIIDDSNVIQTRSRLSDELTKDLKNKKFKFVGSVTIYSYLQAIGIINSHDLNCDFR